MADMFVVASKEFSDIVRRRRFIVLIVLFGLVMTVAMATLYVQVVQNVPDGSDTPMPQRFLGLMSFMLSSTMGLFAPVMGVALGCDTISEEQEKGTLKIVLAQPVFRDTVLNGKFLAATSAVSLAVLITSLASIGAVTIILGVTPTGEEALRTALFLIFAVLYTMTYYSIATFMSTVSKKTSRSIILSIMVWAIFTFVIPIVAALIALMIAPPFTTLPGPGEPFGTDTENFRRYIALVETISSITPNYHFGKIGQYLLNQYTTPDVGALVSSTPTQEPVSVTSSLMYAGPNILVLVIVTILVFIGSYIIFTRQETR